MGFQLGRTQGSSSGRFEGQHWGDGALVGWYKSALPLSGNQQRRTLMRRRAIARKSASVVKK